MPPRSPTLAFDPTPALEHSDFSHFNGIHRHSSLDHSHLETNGKMVHFEEPMSNNVHGRHSIATSHVPLLPPVASASQIPKQAFRMTNPTPGVDITAYFEQCRNVNEQLRSTHEQERKAWEIERTALKTRIADLEFRLNKATGGKRRLSNDSSYLAVRPFRSEINPPSLATANGTRHHHNTISNAPLEHLKQENGKPIWEPASPVPATRVFSHDDDVPPHHLPSISEDGPLDPLSKQTSNENKTIPIQQIDETLDGINVKSEGVKSSFNKVISPIIVASPASPKQTAEPPRMSLDSSTLLDPLDAKLVKNAGHTPLLFDGALSSTATTAGGATPQQEVPIEPAPTKRPPLRPSEKSNSYFSTEDVHAPAPPPLPEQFPELAVLEESEDELEPQYEPQDDRPLTGPLMLDPSGKSEASHNFLEKLDDKLGEVVRKSLSSSPNHSPTRKEKEEPEKQETEDDGFPKLRLKKSTNFGSAFGNTKPGFFER